jgi:hypothetical protein
MTTFTIYTADKKYLGNIQARTYAQAELAAALLWDGKLYIRMCA